MSETPIEQMDGERLLRIGQGILYDSYRNRLAEAAAVARDVADRYEWAVKVLGDESAPRWDLAVPPALEAASRNEKATEWVMNLSLIHAKDAGLSQREVAKELGTTHTTVYRRIKNLKKWHTDDYDDYDD